MIIYHQRNEIYKVVNVIYIGHVRDPVIVLILSKLNYCDMFPLTISHGRADMT